MGNRYTRVHMDGTATHPSQAKPRREVRVLINPKSGFGQSLATTLKAIEEAWSAENAEMVYQFSNSIADGVAKARRAVADGIKTLLVAGGDGMINTIGAELVGTETALGVIPSGSGNGFARHFNIPLQPAKAAIALATAERTRIDVGTANGRPFFVTCSMAWDAALVRHFEKSPVRGILPYVLAGAQGFLEFKTQPFKAIIDDVEELSYADPMVFTVANMTQFGGGARIAPQACADDGYLELVVMARQDMTRILPEMARLFDGTVDRIPQVLTRRFKHLHVTRATAAELQLDGELVDAVTDIDVRVREKALNVLVPKSVRGA